MKKLTIDGFHPMTSKAKTELIKKHLGLDVGDGWKICGYSYRRIIVGRNIPTLCGNGWTNLSAIDGILSKHKYYLYATAAAIAAINKINRTSKTD
jgi:hypothetical protein